MSAHIYEISDTIDTKLKNLELELSRLQEDMAQAESEADKAIYEADIAALIKIKTMLVRSRDMAWRAHRLRNATEAPPERRLPKIIAVVIVTAALALAAWGFYQFSLS